MVEDKEKSRLRYWMELWHEIDKTYISFLKQWDLSLNSYWVVEYLHQHQEGAEPGELAENVNVMRQLISIILNDLEKRGLVLRRESSADHRKRTIKLSKAGLQFAEEVCNAVDAIDLHSLEQFTPAERDLIVEHSQRFSEALKSAVKQHNSAKNIPKNPV